MYKCIRCFNCGDVGDLYYIEFGSDVWYEVFVGCGCGGEYSVVFFYQWCDECFQGFCGWFGKIIGFCVQDFGNVVQFGSSVGDSLGIGISNENVDVVVEVFGCGDNGVCGVVQGSVIVFGNNKKSYQIIFVLFLSFVISLVMFLILILVLCFGGLVIFRIFRCGVVLML